MTSCSARRGRSHKHRSHKHHSHKQTPVTFLLPSLDAWGRAAAPGRPGAAGCCLDSLITIPAHGRQVGTR